MRQLPPGTEAGQPCYPIQTRLLPRTAPAAPAAPTPHASPSSRRPPLQGASWGVLISQHSRWQVPLFACLTKFDGSTFQEMMNGDRRQYVITRLPQYLIIHIKRFSKNTQQYVEKNPTIVNFPVRLYLESPHIYWCQNLYSY